MSTNKTKQFNLKAYDLLGQTQGQVHGQTLEQHLMKAILMMF